MEMKRFLVAIATVFATAGLAAAAGGASIGFGGSRVVGHVYINDNTTGTNTVAGFDRYADGTLTAMPGSPFSVGGAGTGAGIASQGALQLSADGRELLAVDAGSNQISVARILPDGSLQEAGQPVSSNGANPVSIAVHGALVFVANQGTATSSGETNYTGFFLDPFGGLHAL